MNKSKHLLYIDIIRIIAILLVILLHCSGNYIHDVSVKSFNFIVLNFFDSISRIGVPLFFMISGAYFLNNKNDVTVKSLFKKNIFKVLLVLVISSFAIEFTKYLVSVDNITLKAFIKNVVLGDKILWFFYTLIGLYLVTPLLREITKSKEKTQYFIFLYFVFVVLLKYIFLFYDGKTLVSLLNQLSITMFNGYVGYYVLGYYLSNYDITLRKRKIIYILGFIGLFLTFILTEYYSIKNCELIITFYKNNTLNVFLYSIGVFVLIKSIFKEKVNNNKFIKELSSLTIAVYPIHRLLLIINENCFDFNIAKNCIYMVPLYFIVIVVLSYAIAFIISIIVKKISKNKLLFYLVYGLIILAIIFAFSNIKHEPTKYEYAKKVPVITYHRVVSDEQKQTKFKNDQWANSEKDFEKHMKYLKENNYNSLSLDEFYCWYQRKCEIPKKSVLITFDDGDIEVYYRVMPILKKYNLKGVSFVISSDIKDSIVWDGGITKQHLTTELINKIEKEYPNLDIQSHSYNLHRVDSNKKERILNVSKKQLQEDFKKNEKYNFEYFAYPFGVYTNDAFEVLKENNYKLAFKFRGSNYATRNDDKYLISRIKINGQISFNKFVDWVSNN